MSLAMDTVREMPFRSMKQVGRVVFLENVRRREFYVMLILSGIFFGGILVMHVIGIENAATANLLLNLGMSLAWLFAHILTLLNAARQIPDEMEHKTLYPLLAKPLERRHYYLGKWMAIILTGYAALFILLLLGWLPVPKMQPYHFRLFLQVVILLVVSISLLAALGMLLSLILPKGVNVILLGLLLMAGGQITGFIQMRVREGATGSLIKWLVAYLPDFSRLNLITRYTDGIGPLSLTEFLGLILYGVIFTMAALTVGIHLFERRSL